MHLDLLFISQLQQLHSKPWLSLNLLFKSYENSSCYLLTASIMVFLLDNLGACIMRAFHLLDVICVAMKNQTRVASWLTRVLLYDWSLVLATYSVYVSSFDWFIIYSLLRSTRYSSIGTRVSSCLAYVLTIFSPCVTIWLVYSPNFKFCTNICPSHVIR